MNQFDHALKYIEMVELIDKIILNSTNFLEKMRGNNDYYEGTIIQIAKYEGTKVQFFLSNTTMKSHSLDIINTVYHFKTLMNFPNNENWKYTKPWISGPGASMYYGVNDGKIMLTAQTTPLYDDRFIDYFSTDEIAALLDSTEQLYFQKSLVHYNDLQLRQIALLSILRSKGFDRIVNTRNLTLTEWQYDAIILGLKNKLQTMLEV